MPPITVTTWPPDLGDQKERFHVKDPDCFRFTRIRLTGPERMLLEKWGTRFQAFQGDRRAASTGDEYKHFMEVLKTFEASSVCNREAFEEFVKACVAKGFQFNQKGTCVVQIPDYGARRENTETTSRKGID